MTPTADAAASQPAAALPSLVAAAAQSAPVAAAAQPAATRPTAAAAQPHTASAGQNDNWGLYVHVPFCASRCSYCDFNTYAGADSLIPAYFEAVGREIDLFFCETQRLPAQPRRGTEAANTAKTVNFDSVFFGGGTPSHVDSGYIAAILGKLFSYRSAQAACGFPARGLQTCAPPPDAAQSCAAWPMAPGMAAGTARACAACPMPPEMAAAWPVTPGMTAGSTLECTVEANPRSVTIEKLRAWRAAGVNRLSLGLQSTHERHLAMLGRTHSLADFFEAVSMARETGIENISADLLFGLPEQTTAEWKDSLESVLSLGIPHLSCYSLSLEPGTRLARAVESRALPEPDEDADREMYHMAQSVLASAGLAQYEISNFAVPGFECRHNLKYWTGAPYRGFGAGAASFDGAAHATQAGACLHDNPQRHINARTIAEYTRRMQSAPCISPTESGSCAGKATFTPARPSEAAVVDRETIDGTEAEREFLILRLRLAEGFSLNDYRERFGRDFLDARKASATKLIGEGLLEIAPAPKSRALFVAHDGCALHSSQRSTPIEASGRARLTAKGMDLANRVFVEFM